MPRVLLLHPCAAALNQNDQHNNKENAGNYPDERDIIHLEISLAFMSMFDRLNGLSETSRLALRIQFSSRQKRAQSKMLSMLFPLAEMCVTSPVYGGAGSVRPARSQKVRRLQPG
jgi:hypothetical protein